LIAPLEALNRFRRAYPDLWPWVEQAHLHWEGVPRWPDWCFLPDSESYAVLTAVLRFPALGPDKTPLTGQEVALGTWRYTKELLRFNESGAADLGRMALTGELPPLVLERLPERCVYVESPGLVWDGRDLLGFWANLEYDTNHGFTELRFLLHQQAVARFYTPPVYSDHEYRLAIVRLIIRLLDLYAESMVIPGVWPKGDEAIALGGNPEDRAPSV